MTSLGKRRAVLFCLLAMLPPTSVWASTGPTEPGGRREPPKEAFEACREKSEGDVVEVTTPRGETIKAACRKVNGKLAAMPDRGASPPGSGEKPPEEGGGK
jgi:hypothetical protein